MITRNKAIAAFSTLLIIASGLAFAHSGASGIVKERMDMMGEIGDSMKIIGTMIKGESDYDAKAAKAAAMTIYGHASHISEMFPEGSTQKPTEALPAIWNNWDEFERIANIMKDTAKELADVAGAASDASQIRVQFGAVGKSCGSCHEKFRLKKQ